MSGRKLLSSLDPNYYPSIAQSEQRLFSQSNDNVDTVISGQYKTIHWTVLRDVLPLREASTVHE